MKKEKSSTLKIKPLGDKVLIKPFGVNEGEKKTNFGLIIPDTASKEKPEQGVVVAVGEGKLDNGKRVALSVRVGDKVVFSKYGYDEIKIEGEEYYILSESSILAIIK